MSLKIDSSTVNITVDLGTVSVSGTLVSAPDSEPHDLLLQLWQQNIATGVWSALQGVNADGSPLVVSSFPAGTAAFNFKIKQPIGAYKVHKISTFQSGSNYTHSLGDISYDSGNAQDYEVKTTQLRVTAPIIVADETKVTIDAATGKVWAPYTIKIPKNYVWVQSNGTTAATGFYVMLKGSNVFQQLWVAKTTFVAGNDPNDDYLVSSGVFKNTMSNPPGLYSPSLGLFLQDWAGYSYWLDGAITFSVGDWATKTDAAKLPTINKALAKGKAPFAIGGNFGNAVTWTNVPANNNANFFSVLKYDGLSLQRVNYDPTKYNTKPYYPQVIDNLVNNIWSGGGVPILAPQDIPAGATLAESVTNLQTTLVALATKYKDQPVIVDLLNEPHAFGAWSAWKPIAIQLATAIREVAPNAYIICPFEGYSEDGTAAELDPLPAGLVNAYALHSYHATNDQVASKAPATLPYMLQEYHNSDPAFLQAWISLKNAPIAVLAWAWTTPGQDGLNLITSAVGATFTYTDTGAALLAQYALLAAGKPLVITPPVTPPVDPTPSAPPVTPTDPVQLTQDQIKAIVADAIKLAVDPIEGEIADNTKADQALADRVTADEATIADLKARLTADEANIAAAEETKDIDALAQKEATDIAGVITQEQTDVAAAIEQAHESDSANAATLDGISVVITGQQDAIAALADQEASDVADLNTRQAADESRIAQVSTALASEAAIRASEDASISVGLDAVAHELDVQTHLPIVTSVKIAPRADRLDRIIGAHVQGSHDGRTWYDILAIQQALPKGVSTEIATPDNKIGFRFLRLLSAPNGFCNVSDLQFFSNGIKLQGKMIATDGSYLNAGNTAAKALDGDLNTFYDAKMPSNCFVGLDLEGSY